MTGIDPVRTRDVIEAIMGKRVKRQRELDKREIELFRPRWAELPEGTRVKDKVTRMGGEVIGKARRVITVSVPGTEGGRGGTGATG